MFNLIRRLKSLCQLYLNESDCIPIKSEYISPSGLDYQIWIDGKKSLLIQSFSYEAVYSSPRQASATHDALIKIEQANLTGITRLEPGMRFNNIVLKTVDELGKEFEIAFQDVRVIKMKFKISIDDLMTEFEYECTGSYVEQK